MPDSPKKTPLGNRPEIGANDAAVEALLNIDEVARIIGRAHWTLRRDIKLGKLRCVRIGRRIMIEPSEIRRLIAQGRR
jgi:hypothetical protein